MEIIKINKNDVIVFELDQPASIDQLQRLNESMGKLGVKAIVLEPGAKMKVLKPTEKEEDREDKEGF